MTDMTPTIEAKSSQLNADDLMGGPRTVKITKVSANASSNEQPIAINYDGDNGKPFYPCKTVRRLLVSVWGNEGSEYVGRRMTLFRDPDVLWGGLKVGGIRVSHMSDIDTKITIALTATRGNKKPYTVHPLAPDQTKELTPIDVYGKELAAHMNSDDLATWWDDTAARRDELGIPPERLAKMQAAVTAKLNPNGDDA